MTPEQIAKFKEQFKALGTLRDMADALDEVHEELSDAMGKCAYWEIRAKKAEARCEALERAIIWNGMYCSLCTKRYRKCTKADGCSGFQFDEAPFAKGGENA